MKLASFELQDARRSFGVVQEDGSLIDISAPGIDTLKQALAIWPVAEMASRAAFGKTSGKAVAQAVIKRWLPPILNPEKILCVGLNYRHHAEEAGMPIPAKPSLFVRFPSSQVGHLEPTRAPSNSVHYDYEAELAVIIGKGGRNLDAACALDAVAGYACFAENSIRDFQRHATQATAGKNFEASGAFGPWITTADSIPDPQSLRVIGRLNGTEVQNGETADMIFSVAETIAYVSSFTALVAGDVIVTGTPAGVGFTRTPPLYLTAGDVFEVDIPGVGCLSNPVLAGA